MNLLDIVEHVPEQPLRMMDKYGVAMVLLIIMTIFAFFLVKFILKKMTNMETRMNEMVDQLINKDNHNAKEHTDNLENFAPISYKVQQLTYYLLNELEADRISIFEYHNGGKTITGVDFQKCSNTYEAVELGIEPKYKDYQNIPISTNFLWSKLLVDKKSISICDIEDLKDKDYTIFTNLKSQQIQSYYSRLILDYDNKPLGFIVITYYNNKIVLTDEQLKIINDTTISIGGLINKN